MKWLPVLLLCLMIKATMATETFPLPPDSKNHQFTDNMVIKRYSLGTLVLITLATELIVLLASDTTKHNMAQQVLPKNLIKNFISSYATHASATILHEAGHATAARLITGKPATINLGSYDHQEPLITMGKVTIGGLDPIAGITSYASPLEQRNKKIITAVIEHCKTNHIDPTTLTTKQLAELLEKLITEDQDAMDNKPYFKETIILFAGGCTAIISHYLIKILLSWFEQWIQTKNPSLATASATALTIDPILTEQLFTMLWPIKVSEAILSDGGRIWQKCFGIDPQIVTAASTAAPVADLLAELAITYHQTTEGQQPPVDDLLLVAFLNYKLRGYLRFTL